MNNHLDRITIVLHRPIHPGNVGSVARAMKNMGLHRLRMVAPCYYKTEIADWMAVSAKDILERAEVFENLKDALHKSNLVIGTIPPNRPRFQSQTYSPERLASHLQETHPDDQISILFGPEDNGLSNDQLDLCHEFVTIPSHSDYPSLNLAQSVMVIAYEIFNSVHGHTFSTSRSLADKGTLEEMFSQLEETLLAIGFLNRQNPGHMMRDLRRILGRAGLDERESRIVRGILRQINWAAKNKQAKED